MEIVQCTDIVIAYWVPTEWYGDCRDARMAIAAPQLFDAFATLVRRVKRDNLHTRKAGALAQPVPPLPMSAVA